MPTDTMPGWLAAVAGSQPLTHMVDALRGLTQADLVDHDPAGVVLALAWASGIAVLSLLISRRRLDR